MENEKLFVKRKSEFNCFKDNQLAETESEMGTLKNEAVFVCCASHIKVFSWKLLIHIESLKSTKFHCTLKHPSFIPLVWLNTWIKQCYWAQ